MLLVSGRYGNFTCSQGFAASLKAFALAQLQARQSPLDVLAKWLRDAVKLPHAGVPTLDFQPFTSQLNAQLPLPELMAIYTSVVSAAVAEGAPPPVFVLDEANRLRDWLECEQALLRSLLQFFVGLSKERNEAHCVLATSDASFPGWLEERFVSRSCYRPLVLGNLPEDAAREYYTTFLQLAHPSAVDAACDATWAAIHSVCDGNPGALNEFSALAAEQPALGVEAAVTAFLAEAREQTYKGLHPAPGAGWRGSDFRRAAAVLMGASGHAVDEADLEAALGEGGAASMAALLNAYLLGFRSALPIGESCTDSQQPARAYTPTSAAQLVVWRECGLDAAEAAGS